MALPTVNQLSDRIRRAVHDWPAADVTLNSATTTATTIGATISGAIWKPGSVYTLEQESVFVQSVSGSTATVIRGWFGSTATSHAASTPILVSPFYSSQEILDAISDSQRALWPYFFKYVEDESIVTTSDLKADYQLPSAFGNTGLVTDVQVLFPGLSNDGWRTFRWYETRHAENEATSVGGTTGRIISLIRIPPVGTYLRLKGLAPFEGDLAAGGTLPTSLQDAAVPAIIMYSTHLLLANAEGQRMNQGGFANVGPMSVQEGKRLALSEYHLQRFNTYCQTHAQRWPTWRTHRKM